ncbi:TPA: polysaccharide biosynthesis C-terminal domain-containing protein [archaeon]|uniref:Polysaccharide biosynthesis C-terminal domain-containing protein n=1 Tax=Candidatus Naiadarchaeum limnaeum TaxID=2756139 RepID=A0A832V0U0_9ARCH|nr:polysaccharide biosynthesis C-terminal domain-containing protein [Candidatus Naiadarchaeum limnaeum]
MIKHKRKKYLKIGREIGFSYILVFLQFIVGPLLIALLTRILGAEKYGIYALFSVFVGLFSLILQPGLSQYLITKLPSYEEKKWPLIFFSVISFEAVFVFAILTIFYFSPLGAMFLDVNKLATYKSLLAVSMVIIFFSTIGGIYDYYYRAKQRINLANFMEFFRLKGWALPLFVLFLLFRRFDLFQVFLAWGIFVVLTLLIYFWKTKKELFYFIRSGGAQYNLIKPALIFGFPLISTSILSWVIAASDRYILNYFTSASVVGIYSLAYSLLGTLFTMAIIVSSVILPYFSEAWWKDKKQYSTLLNASLKYGLIMMAPGLVGAFVLRNELITLISGPQYIAAAPVVKTLLLYPLFLFLSSALLQVLMVRNQNVFAGFVFLFGGILNIGLNILLIPPYGMHGAAIATVLSYLLMFLLTLYKTRVHKLLDYNFVKLPRIVLSAIIMGAAISFIHPTHALTKLITLAVGAGIYFALLFLTKVFDKNELKLVRGALFSFKKIL